MLCALGSAVCDTTHEIGGTNCCGNWVLCFAISHTKLEVRFATGIVFCILVYHTRDGGYDLLRPLGPASFDVTHETRGTTCFGHWVLRLMVSRTKQGVRFVTGIRSASFDITLFILRYHTRDRGYDLLRTLGPEYLVISPTNRRGYSLLGAGLGILLIAHETRGTVGCGQWALHLVTPHTRQGGSFVTGIVLCIL